MVFNRPRTRSERNGTLPIQYDNSLWYSSDENNVREIKRSETKRNNGGKDRVFMKNRYDKGKNVDETSHESDDGDDDDVRIIGEKDNPMMKKGKSGISLKNARKSSVVWKNDEKSSKKMKKKKVEEDVSVEVISNDESEDSISSSDSVYYSEPSSSDDVAVSSDDTFIVSDDSSSVGEDEGDDDMARCKKMPVAERSCVAGKHSQKVTKVTKIIKKGTIEMAEIKKEDDILGTSSSCPFILCDDEEKDVSDFAPEAVHSPKVYSSEANFTPEADFVTEADTVCNKNNDWVDIERGNEGKKKVERPTKKVHNDPIARINKIFVDSIWEKGGSQLENLGTSVENSPDEVPSLPLKFSFESSDDENVPSKSYWDIESEKLFGQMDYMMGLVELGNSDDVTVDSEKNLGSCQHGGDHHLVLDEQIGLRCTICGVVVQEIADIMPDFATRKGGRARDFNRVDFSNIDTVLMDDFTATQLPGHNHYLPSQGTVWDLIPGTRDTMYPHQREGFEFIWKNIGGSIYIDEAKKCVSDGGGNGCIISHAPGTGKTRLTITFIKAYMHLNPDCRPLIIAPCTVLLTWEQQFRNWNSGLPFHNLNTTEYSGKETATAVNLLKNCRQNLESTRLVKLLSWTKEKSVLGISYQLFEELANAKVKNNDQIREIREMLFTLPGLLVLDEGHIPRSEDSKVWKALLRVKTERRIMLSGTPFQNNFQELLNTICLARPNFLEKIMSQNQGKSSEKWIRIKNATREKWASMTDNISKDENRLKDVKGMINEFVHVYKGTVLKEKLPGLTDFVVVLSPKDLQKELIEIAKSRKSFFDRDHILSLIAVHPTLFLSCPDSSENQKLRIRKDDLEKLRLKPEAGVKTKFLTELVSLSGTLQERVLVFSQFIDSLKFIMRQLEHHFHWTRGKEILFMGGEHDEKQRQMTINKLNDTENEVRVLLASTRAFSEGISLVGASRVVLLDVNWNPSITKQSISRAYRLGQKKIVHVYHLIDGTWEWNKFMKAALKERISDLVFSSKDGDDKPKSSYSVSEDRVLHDMVQHPKMKAIFSKILDLSKESDLKNMFDWDETEILGPLQPDALL